MAETLYSDPKLKALFMQMAEAIGKNLDAKRADLVCNIMAQFYLHGKMDAYMEIKELFSKPYEVKAPKVGTENNGRE